MTFPLTTEPWLPVVRRDGARDELGLVAVVTEAHTLRRIIGETPPMTAALHRLVLALLHRVYGPPDRARWAELWDRKQFPSAELDGYLEKYGDRFDLFDPERPFFQCPAVAGAAARSAAALVPHRSTGNNVTLFDHTTAGDEVLLTPAEAARWLITLQAYDPGGLKTPYRAVKSSRQAPANRFGMVLVEGGDLKETLLLNLMPYSPADSEPKGTTIDDRPMWEVEPPSAEPDQRYPHGWTDQLTWPSRRVWLSRRSGGDSPVVDKVVITPGVRLQAEDEPDDGMAAYRRSRKGRKDAKDGTYTPWRAVRIEDLKGAWRHTEEFLLAPVDREQLPSRRPRTLEQVAKLAEEHHLPYDAVYTMRVFGQQLDSNGGVVEQVLEEAMSAPVALLRARSDSPAGFVVGYSVRLADHVGEALRTMGREYGRAFQAGQYLNLDLAYWPRLASPYDEFLRTLGAAIRTDTSFEPVTTDWRKAVWTIADSAAQEWVENTPRRLGRHIEAAGRCYGRFLDDLNYHASGTRASSHATSARRPHVETQTAIEQRRDAFIQHLYGLYHALESQDRRRSADARRTLAQLRRGLHGGRHKAEAYHVVFPLDPPDVEQEQWLLVACLFAMHPHANIAKRRSLGDAMGQLADGRSSVKRRFTQLLPLEGNTLEHYLRQAIQVLRAGGVGLDYRLLLDDLVKIAASPERAHKVRLRWARDFHRPRPSNQERS